jgi:hypothetical protein
MKVREIGPQRLTNLHIASSRCRGPADVVRGLGAMQAQDYAGGLWAIGLRVPGATLADVEGAVARAEIVRSWPLRGTLHFVAADELGWMLDLLSARVQKAAARRQEGLGLDPATFAKVETLLRKELARGARTRDSLRDAFTRAGISPEGGRLYHCLLHFALRQLICFATHEGKQPTFALFDAWLPKQKRLHGDEALGELATRYYTSHGPATQQDLMRWAGLTAAETKRGIANASTLQELTIEGKRYWTARDQPPPDATTKQTFLLPGFDEYILGYADRSAILDPAHANQLVPGSNGVFRPTLVHAGRVLGTWKSDATRKSLRLTATDFTPATASQQRAFTRAASAYATFLGKPLANVPSLGHGDA